jgi:hypothetical protein
MVQSTPPQHEGVTYVDDAQNYNYDHGGDQDTRHRPQSRASQHTTHSMENSNGHYAMNGGGNSYHRGGSHQSSGYPYQQSQYDDSSRSKDDEMWG